MLRHRFLTALATPAGPSLKTASRSFELGRLLGLLGGLAQPLGQRRIVAGEAGRTRRDRHGVGERAHLGGRRLAELVAARGDVARPAADVGRPGLEGLCRSSTVRAAERGRALPQLLDVGLHRLEPGAASCRRAAW